MSSSKKYSRWSKEEEKFLIENYKNMPIKEIAKALGKTEKGLCKKKAKLGISNKRDTAKVVSYIEKNYDTMSSIAIAKHLGITKQTVTYHIKKIRSKAEIEKRNSRIRKLFTYKGDPDREEKKKAIYELLKPFERKENVLGVYKKIKDKIKLPKSTFYRLAYETNFESFDSDEGKLVKIYLDGNANTPNADNIEVVTKQEYQRIYYLNGNRKSQNPELTKTLLELVRLENLTKKVAMGMTTQK